MFFVSGIKTIKDLVEWGLLSGKRDRKIEVIFCSKKGLTFPEINFHEIPPTKNSNENHRIVTNNSQYINKN